MYQLSNMHGKTIKIDHVIFVAVFLYTALGGIGVTAGAHRYWTHKSYRAKLPLRIILVVLHCISGMVNKSKAITFNVY